MQIVSSGDNLHEMSYPVSEKKNKKNIINLSSAEFVQSVVKANSFGARRQLPSTIWSNKLSVANKFIFKFKDLMLKV